MTTVDHILGSLGLGLAEPLLGNGDDSIAGIAVEGAKALKVWAQLKALLVSEGHWPVIVGSGSSITYLRENWEITEGTTVASLLEKAATLDVEEWLKNRRQGDESYYEEVHGSWPRRPEPTTTYVLPTDVLSGRPLERVYLAIVPTAQSWAVPVHLRLGGWNECPFPHEHAAVLKYWFERYDGELVGLSHDTIECAVSAPPREKEAALLLARQQFVYCADIVGQGSQTIENLGGALLNAPVWYFWWD